MWSPDLDEQNLLCRMNGDRGQRAECGVWMNRISYPMNEDFRLGPTLPAGPGGTRAPSRGTMFSDVVAIASKQHQQSHGPGQREEAIPHRN